jgi:hypothetical protein
MENCPKCDYKNEENSLECLSCGVILNKEKLLERIRANEEALSKIRQEKFKKAKAPGKKNQQDLKTQAKAKMTVYSFRREVNLPVEKVWSLLGDFTKAPSSEIEVSVEKEGDITIGKVCIREILDSANPPCSFTYRILSGAPMKEYLGKVKLEPRESSTIIHWSAELTPKIPLTGWLCSWIASDSQNRLIDAVENSIR